MPVLKNALKAGLVEIILCVIENSMLYMKNVALLSNIRSARLWGGNKADIKAISFWESQDTPDNGCECDTLNRDERTSSW